MKRGRKKREPLPPLPPEAPAQNQIIGEWITKDRHIIETVRGELLSYERLDKRVWIEEVEVEE